MPHSLLDSFLLSFTLGSLYISLDYIVHHQYDFTDRFLSRCVQNSLPVLFCLFFIFDRISRVKSHKWAQIAFLIAAICLGARVIHITTADHTFGSMLATPGLVVLWIFLVIELDLSLALISVVGVTIYYYIAQLLDLISHDPSRVFKGL